MLRVHPRPCAEVCGAPLLGEVYHECCSVLAARLLALEEVAEAARALLAAPEVDPEARERLSLALRTAART